MPRPGYTNFPPGEERSRLFEIVCKQLVLDPDKHSSRVQALDYALRVAAKEIEMQEPDTTLVDALDYRKPKYRVGATIQTKHGLKGKVIRIVNAEVVLRDQRGKIAETRPIGVQYRIEYRDGKLTHRTWVQGNEI